MPIQYEECPMRSLLNKTICAHLKIHGVCQFAPERYGFVLLHLVRVIALIQVVSEVLATTENCAPRLPEGASNIIPILRG